ncbi:protein FAM149B1, partial [Aplysia californica]|uniref:Protein FAM149B1 n=1 Tax=Aplysia californica TaxID=6500 RepID=A0ABM1AE25_APLCA
MPLQNRNQMDPSESPVLSAARPGSSFHSQTQLRGSRVPRGRALALAPLGHKMLVGEEERSSSRGVANDALQVKGVPMSGNDSLPSPPSNFQRNTALPPLDMAPQRGRQQGYRATSAIDNKDMRMSFRNRGHLASEQNRPNTTHAMRSETPLGSQSRRSSTPLGNSIIARNSMLSRGLDVRGS